MKLRNKKTGEIGEVGYFSDSDGKILVNVINSQDKIYEYNSLAELNTEWEDYEEPKVKKYWYINAGGEVSSYYEEDEEPEDTKAFKEIGNYFVTKEEAEKAVEKLKAAKRLKDNGFKFKDFARLNDCAIIIRATSDESWSEIYDDLNTCFGGEE